MISLYVSSPRFFGVTGKGLRREFSSAFSSDLIPAGHETLKSFLALFSRRDSLENMKTLLNITYLLKNREKARAEAWKRAE